MSCFPVTPCCARAKTFKRGSDRQYWGYRRRADGYLVLCEYAGMGALEAHQSRGDLVRGPFVAATRTTAWVILKNKLAEAQRKREAPALPAPETVEGA